MRRRTKIAIVAALVCIVPTVGIVVAMRLRPEPLSNGCLSCGDDERPIEPHLTMTPDGHVAVAWMAQENEKANEKGKEQRAGGGGEEDEGAKAIFVRTSNDYGARWKRRRTIDLKEHYVADPTVAIEKDGTVDVAFLGFKQNVQKRGDPYEMNVYVARNFEKPRAIGEFGTAMYDRPWSALASDGGLLVGYRFMTSTTQGIAVFRSDAKGATTTQRVIDGATSPDAVSASLPVLCASADAPDVYLAYVDASPKVVVRHSADYGISWPPDETARASAPDDKVALEAASCVANGHTVVVSYGVSKDPWKPSQSALLDEIVIATSEDAGHTFKRTRVKDTRALMHPALAGSFLAYATDDGVRAMTIPEPDKTTAPPPGPPILPSRVVPSRSDDAWTGDYFGAAVAKEAVYVAAVDNTGPPRLFFKQR
jgi:hypothetical protein